MSSSQAKSIRAYAFWLGELWPGPLGRAATKVARYANEVRLRGLLPKPNQAKGGFCLCSCGFNRRHREEVEENA